MWLPDVEASGSPASGVVVLGINKVECLDNYLDYVPPGDLPAALAANTDFDYPIFVYRGKVSAANVIGVVRTYEGSLDAVSNYGLMGGNAHLNSGPTLEAQVMKAFFYDGADGLTFYMIQNSAGGEFTNTARIFMTEKNNSTGSSLLLSDEPGDIIPIDSDSTKKLLELPLTSTLYDGLFTYTNETAGGIIGTFDDLTEIRNWEIVLDPIDTGNIIMIKAVDGRDDSELILAQGPVKVNFDFSTLREPIGEEDFENDTPDTKNAYGNLVGVDTDVGEEGWWFRFVGDPGGPAGANPYSLLDGTYGNLPGDINSGKVFSIVSVVADQNIRLWRDFEPGVLGFVDGVDNFGKGWTAPFQKAEPRIYSINTSARDKFTDTSRPVTINDLRVLCTSYGSPATTFSVTIIDEDGNAFAFPERTVYVRNDFTNALTWVSFGSPTATEVVMVETDPSTLEEPPSGTIVGTSVSQKFKKELDLRKIKRLIVDIKNAEENQNVLGIHSIAGILDGMPRWPDGNARGVAEPNAYAIIEAFASYWAYKTPSDGYPDPPNNVIGYYLWDWWSPPTAVLDKWNIIPGFEGESIKSAAGPGVTALWKDPMEEIRNNRIIFTPIPPTDGCQMFWKQVDWLERGHRIGAACSFYVVIDGMGFIIVKRSVGTDTTCGGGESADNPCVFTFTSAGEGHPAIAWPSMGGEEFIGKPTSGYVTFIKDDELSERIIDKLVAGDVSNINGDPVNNIPFVIFPSI